MSQADVVTTSPLPPGVSEAELSRAIDAFTAALGALSDLRRRDVRARRCGAGAVGARGAGHGGDHGQRDGRRERAQRPGEGLDRTRRHHPILNTRRATSRAGAPHAG